jgi:sigma-B regulation protein RsbU (phosphoserine phosphatase)
MTKTKAELKDELRQLQSRVKDLNSLIEISSIINSTLNLDTVVQLVMEKAQTVMHAEASSVMLINEETERLECKVALGTVGEKVAKTIFLKKGQGLAGWVWENKKPLIVPDVTKDHRFYADIDKQTGFRTKSILTVPLLAKDRIIGVAQVINRSDGKEFTDQDLDLFLTFCSQVALSIDNARMHQISLEQERMQQQLEAAREIQSSFMPEDLPVHPKNLFQISAINLPAISVSGDFYDAFWLDTWKIGLLIGDVSGKGIPAALYMAQIMSDFRFYVQQTQKPDQLLSLLNDQLVEKSRRGMFVTLQFIVVNIRSGELEFSNGGHLPLLIISNPDKQVKFIHGSGGTALGVEKSIVFQTTTSILNPGDVILMYTDGLTEARNENQQLYSSARLETLVKQDWNDPASMIQGILNDVRTYSNNFLQRDDLTLLALQWNNRKS